MLIVYENRSLGEQIKKARAKKTRMRGPEGFVRI